MISTNEKAIAEKLLQAEAVKLNVNNPFTWASGWKSPIYCDNRKLLSFPFIRDFVKSEMSNVIFENYPEADSIAGVATAGIPWGAMVADQLKLPFLYVRSKPKEHGLGNQIEGVLKSGAKVVMVEDLISTGISSLSAVKAVQNAGGNVLSVVSVFNYGFDKAKNEFDKNNITCYSLTNYNILIDLAIEKRLVNETEKGTLTDWRNNPESWGLSIEN